MGNVLIVDDDVASCRTLQLHLSAEGHQVRVAHDVNSGLDAVRAVAPDLLILDIRMPGKSGLEGLPEFTALLPGLHVIMITAFHDMESTIEAVQLGAEEYIHKPIDIDELDAAVDKILRQSSGELVRTGCGDADHLTMVGGSRAMKEVFKTIGLVARSRATVLITGESGTGKELVAHAIHRSGERPDGPFVVVNCAALVETLLESDMFGHEKGAFTGAVHRQLGKFALANNGTIFLDEIGELSPAMQAKLLRVLQYKEFTPLGAKQPQVSNARIITATNLDLESRVAAGHFREDLYYRLQVVNIHLPPLRERLEDLPPLVDSLLRRINKELHRSVSLITREALEAFHSYPWPGNVRELENTLLKAVALSSGNTLSLDQLPRTLRAGSAGAEGGGPPASALPTLAELERNQVRKTLEAVGWHKGKACEVLGVSRPRLRRMLRDYGIEAPSANEADD